ncbi:type I restriction enzyme HsdR N-terminal domain-containing protein [Mucilaginibacter arboris]|uniref:Restriction endonuclease subunit R n=1 Tax=Mucilaginibacter arboris TaxID=2682090 RepID=A0A7K1SZD9_9SPHI|nr:type I restriction enzyme HsdR N-terminal domain-containing protein [Mucilaginibacter arboris]MVN22682.1 restriction endonuclease subunit R [Mucilaginibacter arboris]
MELLCPLNLPPYPFRITERNGQFFLFDEIRKKTLLITPEEWVRQHFVQYLVAQKKYPKSLVQLEGGLNLHGLAKRSDILVYNSSAEKILLVECKAPTVKITQAVFDQVARYNIVYRVPLLAVTNGLQHFYCKINFEEKKYFFLKELPDYESF